MSLRSTATVGAATLVAGATLAVSAIADDGADPDMAASAAVPEVEQPAADTEAGEATFFSEQLSQEEIQSLREQAREQRDAALGSGVMTARTEGSDIEEEKEEEEEAEAPAFTGDPRALALDMVLAEGWPASEFHDCLEPLWEKESNWNPMAENPSSGAYGIPQSLPGDKMASHGGDWRTNPATQIAWGIDYIKGRYGTPCGAWAQSQATGGY
ncbi:aggregation-promoting factor C-terminal-like domain-containing protein [Nocardiopsis halotolerans]|uniref:aggregation-promoting factor C-terminal-like domain-containing protein n=1 Tax=Nocardiopsis halotolerans TaxID=124252 RepID=UPI0004756CD3|nr:transglycosylase SLT domain-containing protein [Nocardiopsis halotolerans]